MPTRTEQIMGCLLGGCVGDAFASAAEGRFHLDDSYEPNWQVTDDTQMTVATCDAIVDYGGIDPQTIATEYTTWFQAKKLSGLGASTLGALRSLSVGAHWALAGIEGQRASGSGAAMRVAPLAFLLDMDDFGQKQMLRDVVRITHRNEEALAGSQAIVIALQCLRHTPTPKPKHLLQTVCAHIFDSQTRDNIQRLIDEDINTYAEAASAIGTSGFVGHCVPVALCGAQHGATTDLKRLLNDIVQQGGDTDTIASLTGQLVGCAAGPSCIPTEYSVALEQHPWVRQSAQAFANFVVPV